MSLRRTLVVLQIALVAVGLVVFGTASYQLYRQSELGQLRTQLEKSDLPALIGALCDDAGQACGQSGPAPDGHGDPDTGGSAATSTGGDSGAGATAGVVPAASAAVGSSATTAGAAATTCGESTSGIPGNNLTPGSFAELRSSSGKILAHLLIPFSPFDATTTTCPDPSLPATNPAPLGRTFTVNAARGPGPFLVEAASTTPPSSGPAGAANPSTPPSGDVVLVGIPLTSLETSLHRLLALDLTVGGVLLVALAAGSLVLIRRSLRPLERMAATSRAISTGDLSRRVTTVDERTEVGQLGAALNGMLTRIERAFAERDATEQRLRQFLADASHELRTPLTSIRGYAELWQLNHRDPVPAPVSDDGQVALDAGVAMARIEEHARRMGEMIEELLLLARLDESRPLQPSPVDLVVLAAEACDDAMVLDPGRPVSFDADRETVVVGEIAHLRRAVANLLVNAIRHTPPGTRVEVKVRQADGVAEIVVRDHGPGMPAEGLAHAFDRFWQADASRATGGSGLGLAIVAGVAAEHGGSATVTNAPDGGAVLTLRLPLPRPDTRADLRRPDQGRPGGDLSPAVAPSRGPATRPSAASDPEGQPSAATG